MSTDRRGGDGRASRPRAAKVARRTAHGRALAARAVASRRRLFFAALGVIAVMVAIWGGYHAITSYLASRPSGQIDEAVEYVARADVSIIQLDDLLNSRVTSATLDEIEKARSGVQVAVEALDSAAALLATARKNDPSSEEVPILQDAVEARLEMLAIAPSLISVTEASAKALTSAGVGYDAVTAGVESAALAKTRFNPKSDSQLKKSVAASDAALKALAEAKTAFADAQAALPEAAFARYIAYVDRRIEASKALRSAAANLLSNNPASANKQIAAYNTAVARATALANLGLGDVTDIVVDGYKTAAGTLSEDYSTARDKVLGLDELVR